MEHHIPQIMSELAHVNASSSKLKQSLSLNQALFIYTHNTASLNVEKARESEEYRLMLIMEGWSRLGASR